MSMTVSKVLQFPCVAIPMEDAPATQTPLLTISGDGNLGARGAFEGFQRGMPSLCSRDAVRGV